MGELVCNLLVQERTQQKVDLSHGEGAMNMSPAEGAYKSGGEIVFVEALNMSSASSTQVGSGGRNCSFHGGSCLLFVSSLIFYKCWPVLSL